MRRQIRYEANLMPKSFLPPVWHSAVPAYAIRPVSASGAVPPFRFFSGPFFLRLAFSSFLRRFLSNSMILQASKVRLSCASPPIRQALAADAFKRECGALHIIHAKRRAGVVAEIKFL